MNVLKVTRCVYDHLSFLSKTSSSRFFLVDVSRIDSLGIFEVTEMDWGELCQEVTVSKSFNQFSIPGNSNLI